MFALLQRFGEYRRLFGNAGISLALRARFASGPLEVVTYPVGLNHPLHLRLKTSDLPTLQKVWRDQEYAFAPNRAPKFIIDAGANIGIASIFFATQFPNAKVVAFEPEAGNFALLEKNVRPYPNVVPVKAALWKENGTATLFDPGGGPWAFQVRIDGKGEPIVTMTVDEVMQRYGACAIDILKMDIEGAEKEVFEASAGWIDKVGVIMIEMHDRFRPGCSRAVFAAAGAFKHEEHRGETVLLARSEWMP